MESTRDQLAGALYQKGIAQAEIESLKVILQSNDCIFSTIVILTCKTGKYHEDDIARCVQPV